MSRARPLALFVAVIGIVAGSHTQAKSGVLSPEECSLCPSTASCCIPERYTDAYCDAMCQYCELGNGSVGYDEACVEVTGDTRICDCEGFAP
jgi:hypothetical protein